MTFDRPIVLLLLILLVPLGLLIHFSYRRGQEDLARLAGAWRAPELLTAYFLKTFFSALFFGLFVLGAVLALAGPRWGEVLVEDEREGREVVFVLDISRSMLARDAAPSRLEGAKAVARFLLENLEDSRFALVAFKGRALRLLPLTEDVYAIRTFLEQAGEHTISAPGTDIEAGLEAALASLSPAGRRYQAIVLFSDGEALSGNPGRAAARAQAAGVPVFTVAAGTEEGAEIVIDGNRLLDAAGRPVVSRLETEGLQKMAELSGGRMLRLGAESGKELAAELRRLEAGRVQRGFVRVRRERYRLPLAFALVCLSLSLLVRARRFRSGL